MSDTGGVASIVGNAGGWVRSRVVGCCHGLLTLFSSLVSSLASSSSSITSALPAYLSRMYTYPLFCYSGPYKPQLEIFRLTRYPGGTRCTSDGPEVKLSALGLIGVQVFDEE